MIYTVRHVTTYSYSRQIFLEPHTVRLLPRPDPAQQVLEHVLRFDPEPAGRASGLDTWGNGFLQVWFNGLHHTLRVESNCRVQTLRDNPFDYFLPPAGQTLPMDLSPQERLDLRSCLVRRYPLRDKQAPEEKRASGDGLDQVVGLAGMLRDQAGSSSTGFLAALNSWIFENIQRIERQEPGVIDPLTLLSERIGSCRDLAVLFVEICRKVGIPARFVSGYQEGDPDKPEAELHAWAEAYRPGIGWRGYDPTHGLVVADRHIPLAAAPEPEQTMPLSGNFRGTNVTATISHTVLMVPDVEMIPE